MRHPTPRIAFALALLLLGPTLARAADDPKSSDGWIALIGPDASLDAWKSPAPAWLKAGAVHLDPRNDRRLAGEPGHSLIYNSPAGRAPNLVTREKFGDVEVHLEFLVPKGSNSGIKFEGVYEIQIFDSYGIAKPTASHSGGVYPRAELLPRYHHIDEGYPPRVNAAKPPGEWQTMDIVFHTPRFDAAGKKTANARFARVLINDQIVQQDLDVPTPTGNAWHDKEQPRGPILLQGDHGPIAFRNLRVRPLPSPGG